MLLETEPSIKVVGEAVDGQDAVREAQRLQPDVILMDLVMPDGDGIVAIAKIRAFLPEVKIIVLTTFDEEFRVKAAMDAGADGYLLKDADEDMLTQAVHAVHQGDVPLHPHVARHLVKGMSPDKGPDLNPELTEREKEVLQLVARGLSNKAIAHELSLSEGTVKVHVSNILHKLDASSRTVAAIWAMETGMISLHEDE